MVRSMASSSNVDPLPLAPWSRTLKVPAACAGTWGSAMAAASTARPATQGTIRLGMATLRRHRSCSKRMSGPVEGQGRLPRGATGSSWAANGGAAERGGGGRQRAGRTRCPCPATPVPGPAARAAAARRSTCPHRAARRPPTPLRASPLGEVDVVRVVARGRTVAGVVVPADGRVPDLVEPDDVEHAQPVGVGDEPSGEAVAVVPVRPGRDAPEAAGRGREVAGSALRMLAPRAAPEAGGEVGEAG